MGSEEAGFWGLVCSLRAESCCRTQGAHSSELGTPKDTGAPSHLLGTPKDAHPPSPWPAPDHRVCAHDELGLGVPLVVGDVVVGLEPNPLLAFGQKPVAARLPFAKLHHCEWKTESAHNQC